MEEQIENEMETRALTNCSTINNNKISDKRERERERYIYVRERTCRDIGISGEAEGGGLP